MNWLHLAECIDQSCVMWIQKQTLIFKKCKEFLSYWETVSFPRVLLDKLSNLISTYQNERRVSFLLEKRVYSEKQEKKKITADTRIQTQDTLRGICGQKVALGQARRRVLPPSLPVPHHRYSIPI